jgi:hypothetical protein
LISDLGFDFRLRLCVQSEDEIPSDVGWEQKLPDVVFNAVGGLMLNTKGETPEDDQDSAVWIGDPQCSVWDEATFVRSAISGIDRRLQELIPAASTDGMTLPQIDRLCGETIRLVEIRGMLLRAEKQLEELTSGNQDER